MAQTAVLYDSKLSTIKIGAAIATPTTATSFYSQITDIVTDGTTKWFKDVTVSGVSRPVELVTFLGQTSLGLSNQLLDKKPYEFITFSGKLNYSPVDTDKSFIGMITGASGTTIGSGKQYQFTTLSTRAIGIKFTDGSRVIELGINNAEITKVGQITQTAGGHVEMEFEAVGVIQDFYEYVETA